MGESAEIAELAAEKLQKKGIAATQLPLDFAVPLLRECGDAGDLFCRNGGGLAG